MIEKLLFILHRTRPAGNKYRNKYMLVGIRLLKNDTMSCLTYVKYNHKDVSRNN